MEYAALLIGLLVLAIGFAIYLLPSIVAVLRNSKYVASIFVVNLFFGWTLIGWVACLAWALLPSK